MTQPQITREPFGNLPGGEAVDLYTLVNTRGAQARIINYGGILVSLRIPDDTGVLSEVVLGYSDLAGYLANTPYFGALVGRYANRIGDARFVLDNVEYRLAANDGANHLHGGVRGFDKALWRAAASLGAAGPVLDPDELARILGARKLRVPARLLRGGAALSYALRLQPSEPGWLDMALAVPVMDTTRARTELGWEPERSSADALLDLIEGMRHGAGLDTPPLEPGSAGPLRAREFASGVGARLDA